MSDSNPMVATVVAYTIQAEKADALREALERHLVPAAREMPGYRGFLVLDQGDDKRTGVVLFDSREQLHAAQERISAAARAGGVYGLMAKPSVASTGTAIIADGVFSARQRGAANQRDGAA